MPSSYPDGRPAMRRVMYETWPLRADRVVAKVLDIGPGAGALGQLAREEGFGRLIAVEAFAPYEERYNLHAIYDEVIIAKVQDWVQEPSAQRHFALVLMGDVLEHLKPSDARRVLDWARRFAQETLVAVPWLYEQDAVEGNEFERHLQPDLTPEVMDERYGDLLLPVWRNERMGVFKINRREGVDEEESE